MQYLYEQPGHFLNIVDTKETNEGLFLLQRDPFNALNVRYVNKEK